MDGSELLRLVDSLHRDKNIDKEIVFQGIEAALLSAAKKHFGAHDEVVISIDRETGEISTEGFDREIDPSELGRVAAQNAKQVMIQKLREAESEVIFEDYEDRIGSIVSGTVQRFEGQSLIINLGKTEGILPKSEQIGSEFYQSGHRIRATVLDVKKVGHRVRIVLSRKSNDLVRRLFELEVPEISEEIIEVKGLAREPGHRTKIAVDSSDLKVDCVGACVGVRGTRIKNIVDELNGEKIDIIRWSDSSETFLANSLKPAEISSISLNQAKGSATVVVPQEQLSLAIGKKGQNVRLSARLTGWEIDIVAESEMAERRQQARDILSTVPGIGDLMVDRLYLAGYSSFKSIVLAGPQGLMALESVTPEGAGRIVAFALTQVE